jgi:hypothetical protein
MICGQGIYFYAYEQSQECMWLRKPQITTSKMPLGIWRLLLQLQFELAGHSFLKDWWNRCLWSQGT